MQFETPEADMQIKMTAKLKADVEAIAATVGKPVNDWIVGLLEATVAQVQKVAAERKAAEEAERRRVGPKRKRMWPT